MDIERLATSMVNMSISKTDYLTSFINEGDKEPSWDGHIYAYNKKERTNSSLVGRAPVQIKGKLNNNFSMEKITYPVHVSDLRNYLIENTLDKLQRDLEKLLHNYAK